MSRIACDDERSPRVAVAQLQVDAALEGLKIIEACLRLNDPVEVSPDQVPIEFPLIASDR